MDDEFHVERVQRMMWTWRRWCAVVLMVGVFLAPGPAVAGGADWKALFAGKVVVEAVKHPDGFPGVRSWFTVAASRERIWATLTDYANFTKIFQGIDKMRVLAQTQHGSDVEYWINAVLTRYHYVLHREYDVPGRRLTWMRTAGDFKRIEGSWEIRDTPRPGVYMLVYETYVDINGVLPASIVRMEAVRRTREMGERLRNWVEGRPLPDEEPERTTEP